MPQQTQMKKRSSEALADFIVFIDGEPISPELHDDIRHILVETSLHAPTMFEFHVFCPRVGKRFRWIDAVADIASFQIGALVQIAACAVPIEGMEDAGQVPLTLMKGEIATLETRFTEDGDAMLTARGYDGMHKLHCGRKTATFLNMTDTEIVSKVARAAGFKNVDADSTQAVHEHVMQYNQTDMEFLQARARRVGFELFVDAQDVLHFKRVTPSKPRADVKIELTWGTRLRQFEARIGSGRQASAVAVRGWDSNTRQLIEAVYEPPNAPGGGVVLKRDMSAARNRSGKPATTAMLDQPLAAIGEAEAWAQSIGQEVLSEFVEANGTCLGMPAVQAGVRVKIAGIGDRMSGTYLVTSATHTYRQDEEYLTEFTISSRVSDSFAALILDGQAPAGRVAGVVIGVVTNLNDAMKLGRVKVKFPWMGDAPAIESAWCRMAAPMAGPGRGWMCLPEINDEVLVAFEHGDINAPYIVGALWNNRDQPPQLSSEAVKDSKVNLRLWRSRSGHELRFDDTAGSEKVVLSDMTGKNRIEIESSQNRMRVQVAGDCIVKSDGNLTLDSGSRGDLMLKCKSFKLTASGACDLKGAKFDFNDGALEIT